MQYYGKAKIEKVEHRLCEYIRCDNCHKKITDGQKYYDVTTGHHDWGNDSCDSIEHADICEDCLLYFIANYLEETKRSNTAYLEYEPEIFKKNNKYYGDYNLYEDKLVEEDKYEVKI